MMNCDYAIKVSILIDGEMPENEREEAQAHVAACEACRKMEKDFLFFRAQIAAAEDLTSRSLKTHIFPTREKIPFWKKAVALPVPVLAVLLLVFIGFGAWLSVSRFYASREISGENSGKIEPPKFENPAGAFSLARFDNGGRAEIYVAPRIEK